MMNYPIYRTAKVMSVEDPDQLGKIQVKIMPELNGILDENLPWASPQYQSETGNSEGVGTHNVPDLDSYIKVCVKDKYWLDIEYLYESPRLDTNHPYTKFLEEFDIDELTDEIAYPQPKIQRTADGTIIFHDTENGNMGIQHPTGLYVLVDSEGNLFVRFVNKIKIKNEDESLVLQLDNENGETKIISENFVFEGSNFSISDASDSIALFTPLEEILEALLAHKHVAPTGLTTPAEKPDKSLLTSLKSKIKDIKSESMTSN